MNRVSIVLPVYNGARYLRESIDSVLGQTYQDFELIIIDDCSTDETAEIAQEYATQYDNIFYFRNAVNLKLPGALNEGFAKASGEYFTWTSCDNYYAPNALSVLVNCLVDNPKVGLVYSDMTLINDKNQKTGYTVAGSGEDLILRNVVGACFMYRASIAKKIGQYNKDMFLCEDYEYWLRIASVTQLMPLNSPLYYYRFHRDSLSHKHEERIIEKGIGLQKTYYSSFIKTRRKAAQFYAHLRARDIYNSFRQFNLLIVLFFSPKIFFQEVYGLIVRRFK